MKKPIILFQLNTQETNNTIPTKYAIDSGYIIIRKYYEDKNKYLLYITQNGINKILKSKKDFIHEA